MLAVYIGTCIHSAIQKLTHQIPMAAVQLYAVISRLISALRRTNKCLLDCMNLLHGHLSAGLVAQLIGARTQRVLCDADNAGMMNLHENRTSFRMHRLRNAPQTGNLSVLPNAKLRLCELSLSRHAGGLLNNQSCAAASQLPVMLHMLVIDITASVRPIVHNHWRHADAVAYHRIANRKCIGYLFFHRSSPYS